MRLGAGAVLFVSMTLQCSPSSTVQPAPRQSPPLIVSSPSSSTPAALAIVDASDATPSCVPPTPTASASAPPALPRLPLPPAPAGVDKDLFSLAASVCAVAVKRDKGRVWAGCRSCPPFESEDGQPDGKVVTNPESFFPLEAVIRGSFTRPGARQAALVFEGCEPHSSNYGGTLLVESTTAAAGWKQVMYESGVHPDACRPYRRADGRDILVCRYSDSHQSTGTDSVFSFDFALASPDDPEKGWNQLFVAVDNSYSVCWGVSPDGITSSRLEGFDFRDIDRDGRLDLVVRVRMAQVGYSAALEGKIRKECAREMAAHPDGAPVIKSSVFMSAHVLYSLEFTYDGSTFAPTPATKARMSAWSPSP